jgi:hypothetical protein
MKDLKFICVQPASIYYSWQVHLWLESLKQLGHSDKAIVLLYQPYKEQKSKIWDELASLYPEAVFKTYIDEKNDLGALLPIYIPALRPYCLHKWWQEHPEMENCNIFYCDSDVIFTSKFSLEGLLQNDICYLSDTNSYINADYFDSKIKDVIPAKLSAYKQIDVLSSTSALVGINRAICEKHNQHSGGAQYLLKNIKQDFWNKVMQDCISIYSYLGNINKQYFTSTSSGFQHWCSDMWAVLWNLWNIEYSTEVTKQLDFAWATDSITKIENVGIYHNAGIVGDITNGYPTFYKGKYHTGKNPVNDLAHFLNIISHKESTKYCTSYYTQKLINIINKYKLNYTL